jgi:hypothetical protein
MLVFKPRLAAFYVVLFAIITLLSNRVTSPQQKNLAEKVLPIPGQSSTIGDSSH